MIVNIYPSRCALMKGDWVAIEWAEHRYFARPRHSRIMDTGFIEVREPLPPIGVKTRYFKLSGDKMWATLMDGKAYDAGHVLSIARAGRRGMSVVEPEPAKENACLRKDH